MNGEGTGPLLSCVGCAGVYACIRSIFSPPLAYTISSSCLVYQEANFILAYEEHGTREIQAMVRRGFAWKRVRNSINVMSSLCCQGDQSSMCQ